MFRYLLQFCLTPPDDFSPEEREKWGKEWDPKLKPLTIWMTTLGDCQVDLTAHGQELLKLLQEAQKAGGGIVVPLDLYEEVVDDEQLLTEWFIIDTEYTGDFNNDHGLVSVKADKVKPGVNIAGWRNIYVSERFKNVVDKHRLTGIEFVWVRDNGKYRATQWYLPICHKPLGRGLDHPWIKISRPGEEGYLVVDSKGRSGIDAGGGELLRSDAVSSDPLLKELLTLVQSMECLKRPPFLGLSGRYLREHIPDTNFAYTVSDWYEGSRLVRHSHGLAVDRKAWDLLKANRIVTDKECKGVLILNEPPQGVENLDEKYGPADPAFTAEQMARLREWEAKVWAEHIAHSKPPRAPDLKRSLSLLRARKRQTPKEFAKPASAKAIEESAKVLDRQIPAAWQQVLRITNGGRIDKSPLAEGHACIIMPVKDLPQWQKSESKYYRGGGAEIPDSMMFIMTTELGDSIWLDKAQEKPGGDCRVVMMSHETFDEERDCPTVAEFLEELLTETQEEES
jgi:hypothetical protein